MSIPHITAPTNKVFYEFPTTGGTTVLEYTGDNSFQPLSYNTTGTLAHTFVLPDLRQYSLTIGLRITFMNSSTQSITVNASDGSLVMTVDSRTERYATVIGSGSTSSSWSSVGPGGSGGSLSLPLSVSNGGTGSDTNVVSPNLYPGTVQVASRDVNGNMRTNAHIEGILDFSINPTIFLTNSTCWGYLIYHGAGGNNVTLPDEATAVEGLSCRILNFSSGLIYVHSVYSANFQTIPPGYGVHCMFIHGTFGSTWTSTSFFLNNISAGENLSVSDTFTYGSAVMNIGYNGALDGPPGGTPIPAIYYQSTNPDGADYYLNQPFPFNYEMSSRSSKTTIINSAYQYAPATLYPTFPQVFLPDVSTIPLGSTYKVYFNNQLNGLAACQYQVRTSKTMGSKIILDWAGLTGGQQNNCTLVCISNDASLGKSAWNFSSTSAAPNILNVILDVSTLFLTVIPILGQAVAAIRGIIAIEEIIQIVAAIVKSPLGTAGAVVKLTGSISKVAAMGPKITTVQNTSGGNITLRDEHDNPMTMYDTAGTITTAGTLPTGLEGYVQAATRSTDPSTGFMTLSTFCRQHTI